MKKGLLAIWLICFLPRLGLAGFYFQAEFLPNPASTETADKKTEEKKTVEPDIVDIWLDGTSIKLHWDKEEVPWVIWEGKKEWFAVGILLESEKEKKPEKVALTGTVDEVLKIIEDFLAQLKALMAFPPNMQEEEVKKIPPQEELKKVKIRVNDLPGERNIAGCATRGISVEVLTDEKITGEMEIWFCPEIFFEAMQKSLISVQEKLKKFVQKLEKEFSSMKMVPQQEVPDAFTVEWKAVMEKIQGVPFEVIAQEKRGDNLEKFSVYRVKTYRQEEFPASLFTVPKDYRLITFTDLLQMYNPLEKLGSVLR
ncbi:MAG: hypothetical protein ACK4G3_00055 [bacterium]